MDTVLPTIRELHGSREMHRAARLFARVWDVPGLPLTPELLLALAHTGNYVAGALAGDELIAASVGFLGRSDGDDLLHSHITGVLPDARSKDIGFRLKQHQRTWCLDRGIRTVTWTFDPLVRRNAYFNLTKLGARATEYLVNFYGQMDDGINRGEESDRLVAHWRLDSPRATNAAAGRHADPAPKNDAPRPRDGVHILERP
jgi:predicted GNAT superfamily acetyltransferase